MLSPPDSPDKTRELSRWRMAAYAMPALPVAFLYLPLPILIPPFYAQHLGLPVVLAFSFRRSR